MSATDFATAPPVSFNWRNSKIKKALDPTHAGMSVNDYFTLGGCWNLARHIHDITGWATVVIGNSHYDLNHAAVLLPNGLVLDIQGASLMPNVTAAWGKHYEIGNPESLDLKGWDIGIYGSDDAAEFWARKVIVAYVEAGGKP